MYLKVSQKHKKHRKLQNGKEKLQITCQLNIQQNKYIQMV